MNTNIIGSNLFLLGLPYDLLCGLCNLSMQKIPHNTHLFKRIDEQQRVKGLVVLIEGLKVCAHWHQREGTQVCGRSKLLVVGKHIVGPP